MSLVNKTISNSFKDLLQVDNSNNGITTTRKDVKSGDGTTSSISLSDDSMRIVPQNDDTTATFQVISKSGTELLKVDSTNTAVKILGQYANTGVKQFGLSSKNQKPSTSDTWTAISAMGTDTFNTSALEMGTGSTPATTYDVSGGNVAHNFAMHIWYVPFDIAIDSCNVWFGSDASSGDVVKFSLMSYTISTANDATGGDLSAGTEVCVSPSTVTSAGYEQAYYQALTVSSANVNSGKAIVACVQQDGTNSDLTVNMQLVYHLRST